MNRWLRNTTAALCVGVLASWTGAGALAQTVGTAPACLTPPCTIPIASSQLRNLTQMKDEIKAYYEGGSYAAEVAVIEAEAQRYMDQRVHDGAKNPAIVLDIDDTSLSSYAYEVAHDFGFDETSWNAYATKGFAPIDATVALARHAQVEKVIVFFVTGRRTPQADLTRKNLIDAGYTIGGLYLRPIDDKQPSVIPYKSASRADIESKGYTVLETIGDQWSDLDGGHAERAFKLPNPMYFLP
jgi:predicted secreted acid phosphatase